MITIPSLTLVSGLILACSSGKGIGVMVAGQSPSWDLDEMAGRADGLPSLPILGDSLLLLRGLGWLRKMAMYRLFGWMRTRSSRLVTGF